MDPAANTTTSTNFGFNPPTADAPSPIPADSSTTPVFQTVAQNNPPSSPPPTEPATTVVVEAPPKGGGSSPKKILAALAVFLMVVGIGAGVFIVRNQDITRTSAWNCSLYTFAVSKDGTVTVANGSTKRREPQQQAQVYINDNLVETFSVPALNPGEGITLGTISVPTNQSYSWRVVGTIDCQNSGQVNVSEPSASCGAIVAYDKNWAPLTAAQLSALSEGDIVRFAVSGTTSAGAFERARFTINGGTAIEVTDKKPGSEEFYYEYKIPKDTYNFTVNAQIFHDSLGWL